MYKKISDFEWNMDTDRSNFGEDSDPWWKFPSENWEAFTKEEINQISELTGCKVEMHKFRADWVSSGWSKIPLGMMRISHYNHTTIIKIKDEWFYVFFETPSQQHIYGSSFIPSEDRYYKCDQLDGLLSCLKFIKNDFRF